jgi:hypothetical protein
MASTKHETASREVRQRVFDFDWTKVKAPTANDFKNFSETLSDEEYGKIYGKKNLKLRIQRRKGL